MSLKLLLALAACLPLALAGCQGVSVESSPGGYTVRAPARILDRVDVSTVETTDVVWVHDGREVIRHRTLCSDTAPSCPVVSRTYLNDDYERSHTGYSNNYGAEFLVLRVLNSGTVTPWTGSELSATEGELDGDLTEGGLINYYRNSSVRTDVSGAFGEFVSALGEHAGMLALSIPSGSFVANSWASAYGHEVTQPLFGQSSWTGGMVGTHLDFSTKLIGEATVTYVRSRNAASVRITNVRKETSAGLSSFAEYTGPEEFYWSNLAVTDGSFSNRSATDKGDGYIRGNFYGSNAEESAGVFQRERVAGAWLAIEAAEQQARYTERANRQ